MRVTVRESRAALGQAAAGQAVTALENALRQRGEATLVVATGTSQFDVLETLSAAPGVRWERITVFHLDEYVGIGPDHPASFRRFLRERFIDRLPAAPAAFHQIDGQATDPAAECRRLGLLVPDGPFDVALIGIGENGHLAFNDPPADFATPEPYLLVTLDERCRQQQVGEGWFPSLADVPTTAISMSVRRILNAECLVCSVPDERKAIAVQATVEGPVSPDMPASILKEHGRCELHLDRGSASLLGPLPEPSR
jgi:glucosamine-6-phosphate deaminase